MHKHLRWEAMRGWSRYKVRVHKAEVHVRNGLVVEDTSHVGSTIRMLRITAGLTQSQLAIRANVSLSLLSKVECGDRAATPAFMATVARALQVPIERLTGQLYLDDKRDQQTYRDIDTLRETLRHYDLPARPLGELTAEVADLTRLQRNADSRRPAARLPELIEELTVAAHHTDPTTTANVYGLLVLVSRAAHALLLRLGYRELAFLPGC